MSDSVGAHRRQPTRLLCPWDSPGKNTGVGCHFLLQCMKVKSESEVVTQSCSTLRDPIDSSKSCCIYSLLRAPAGEGNGKSCPTLSYTMDCSLPGFSIHGIFQARVLEWGATAFSVLFYNQKQFKFLKIHLFQGSVHILALS